MEAPKQCADDPPAPVLMRVVKTFVSTNLVAVIAQSGKRVLVVDTDMRKGYTHKLLIWIIAVDFLIFLSEKVEINKVVKPTAIVGTDLITEVWFLLIPAGN